MLEFIKKHQSDTRFGLLCIFIATCAVVLPIALFGIPAGTDLQQHLQFAATYQNAILSGDFFPGWAANENFGFGSVGIRFYPPIPYYLLAFTQFLTGNWYDSFWINAFFWMFLGCVGVYFWVKDSFSATEATIAAVLYAFVPYHLFQIYQAGLFAEFAVAGILPFCFLFIQRLVRRGNRLDVLLFGISFSTLILTHIPLTIIGSISLAVYALFLIDWSNFRKIFVNFLLAFSLSLSATAFYWLRFITEINWVKHNSNSYSSGNFDFRQYLFPTIYSMGETVWHFDLPIFLSFVMILPLGIYLFLKNRPEHRNLKALTFTGAFALFMMTAPSVFIWNYAPVLHKIQFPWRWLSIASLISVYCFAVGISKLSATLKTSKRFFNYGIIAVLLTILIFDLTQSILTSVPLSRSEFAEQIENLSEKKGCECWWTTWAKPEALDRKDQISTENRPAEIKFWNSEAREFQIEHGAAQKIRIATFYYPQWKALVNEKEIVVEKDADGSILIPVSAEKSAVKLYFQEPLMLKIALIVSLSTWGLLAICLLYFYRKKAKLD